MEEDLAQDLDGYQLLRMGYRILGFILHGI